MATQVIIRIYPNTTNDYYAALAADMSGWYDWDDVVTNTSQTIFKKYVDEENKAYVAIRLDKSSSFSIYALYYNGVNTYNMLNSSLSVGAYNTTTVINNNGFVFAGTSNRQGTSVQTSFGCVGIWKSKNVVDGSSGVCTFITQHSSQCVAGKSATSASSLDFASPATNKTSLFTVPIVGADCDDVPEAPLRMLKMPDSLYSVTQQNCIYNGKEYVRIGYLLVPKE